MKRALNNNIILAEGLSSTRFQTAKLTFNNHIANFLTGVSYFYVAITPLTTLSDYIGFKSTMGGLTWIKSMLNISFNFNAKTNASNVHPTTSDLNLVKVNQPKTKYRVRTVLLPI